MDASVYEMDTGILTSGYMKELVITVVGNVCRYNRVEFVKVLQTFCVAVEKIVISTKNGWIDVSTLNSNVIRVLFNEEIRFPRLRRIVMFDDGERYKLVPTRLDNIRSNLSLFPRLTQVFGAKLHSLREYEVVCGTHHSIAYLAYANRKKYQAVTTFYLCLLQLLKIKDLSKFLCEFIIDRCQWSMSMDSWMEMSQTIIDYSLEFNTYEQANDLFVKKVDMIREAKLTLARLYKKRDEHKRIRDQSFRKLKKMRPNLKIIQDE